MEKLIDPQNLSILLFFVLPGYLSCAMWRLFFREERPEYPTT